MNRNEEAEVRSLLARAADDLPAGGVPAQTLLVAGERVVRRRRRSAVAAVAAVAAVVLLGSAAVLGGPGGSTTPADQGGRSPERVAPSRAVATPSRSTAALVGPVTTRGRAPTVAPARFDPTRRSFRLGWLPPGAIHQATRTDATILSAEANVPDPLEEGGPVEPGSMMAVAGSVTVRMGARGVDIFSPQLGSGLTGQVPATEAPGRPVASVDGHPAYLHGDRTQMLLSWQYAPGGWISVTVWSMARPEEVARQVAAGLTWQDERVTVPFRPVDVPSRATLAGMELRTWEGRWLNATAYYRMPGGDQPNVSDLSIGVSNGMWGRGGSELGRSKLRVDGRVAAAVDGPKGLGAYRVAQVPGCRDCVVDVGSESSAGLVALGGRSAALRLAAAIRLVADPTDPTSWRPL
ncbi:hypothetical protein GA0074696_4907 [Micromonospora purpureochromogenes]|uniref:Uncharacterized protein n=1 Tax=Micromonospora purpureochromogenes TaxID=47872 RepID=A0A1C4ZV13_9ACTN|nr:hypothetical protein [Micromonospora purpureochromogenes]SCF36614.1 hypothetical protein GA0074696_4907 [Micromonospora purpureochromogenes]